MAEFCSHAQHSGFCQQRVDSSAMLTQHRHTQLQAFSCDVCRQLCSLLMQVCCSMDTKDAYVLCHVATRIHALLRLGQCTAIKHSHGASVLTCLHTCYHFQVPLLSGVLCSSGGEAVLKLEKVYVHAAMQCVCVRAQGCLHLGMICAHRWCCVWMNCSVTGRAAPAQP